MGKRPKVFENDIDKMIHNNMKIFDSSRDDIVADNYIEDKRENNDNLNVKEKIKKLINKKGYIFNVPVEIITKNNKYNTYIASVINNHILTLDNDIINIEEISDIKY